MLTLLVVAVALVAAEEGIGLYKVAGDRYSFHTREWNAQCCALLNISASRGTVLAVNKRTDVEVRYRIADNENATLSDTGQGQTERLIALFRADPRALPQYVVDSAEPLNFPDPDAPPAEEDDGGGEWYTSAGNMALILFGAALLVYVPCACLFCCLFCLAGIIVFVLRDSVRFGFVTQRKVMPYLQMPAQEEDDPLLSSGILNEGDDDEEEDVDDDDEEDDDDDDDEEDDDDDDEDDDDDVDDDK